jgi:hypothetical protein
MALATVKMTFSQTHLVTLNATKSGHLYYYRMSYGVTGLDGFSPIG